MGVDYSRLGELSQQESCFAWVILNEIKNEKGELIEFRDHAFLQDIYDDWTQVQTIRKASQIGFSLMEILKSFWGAKHKNYNFIYSLPTFSDVGQFVPSKINALISQNPILAKWTQDKDTILQKKVGNSFIYYRGTFAKGVQGKEMESGVGIMFSADGLIMDECDRSSQKILEQYESRLEASDYQGKWYFSNPTSPNTLSQKLWEKSDQKHWFIKCSGCNLWQYLDFWKNIQNGRFVCQKCGKEITDDQRRNGQWIKKYPSRSKDVSGYWISHLICPWISAQKIQQEYETKTRQYFYNFVLGLPYIGSDITVNQDVILRNIDLGEPNFREHNVLGVDQGLKKHYVLGNKQGIFKVGVVDKWERIEELIKIYDVERAVFDALPDLTEPRKLKEKYPGIIWLHYFKREVKKADFIFWDSKTHTVYSDRSKIIGQVIDEMVNRKIRFQMKAEDLEEYVKHWQSLYKTIEKDNMKIEREVWKTSGEDHLCFATLYWRLALDKSGDATISEWNKEEKINTGLAPEIQRIIKQNEQYEI